MKSPLMRLLILLAVAAAMTAPATVSAEPADSINLGFGGVPALMKHCKADVYIVEYEHMLTSKLSVLGRGSEVVYKFDDGEYVEEGKPRGGEIGGRYYPGGGMKGFFIGGSVGYWRTDWTFRHNKDLPTEVRGESVTDSIRANLDIGGRFPINSSNISIMPELNIGRFFPSTTCSYTSPPSQVGAPCSQETEVKAYVFLAVMAGIGF